MLQIKHPEKVFQVNSSDGGGKGFYPFEELKVAQQILCYAFMWNCLWQANVNSLSGRYLTWHTEFS